MTLRSIPRTFLLLSAAAFWLFGVGVLFNQSPKPAHASGWQATDYPPPNTTPVDGYPGPGGTLGPTEPYPGPGDPTLISPMTLTPTQLGQPTLTPGGITATPTPTLGQATQMAITPGRDLFSTEDAEMSAAQVTPPPSETPTPFSSSTPEVQITPDDPAGFQVNRRMFLIGLLVPLSLAVVGGLLYKLVNTSEFH